MNEQEANKKAKAMIVSRTTVFCPLTKETCNITCECYKMPEVYQYDALVSDPSICFDVRHGFCTCYALKGVCE